MMISTPRSSLCLLALGAVAMTDPAQAQSVCAPDSPSLIVYHAGSLTAAFSAVETLFTQQTGTCITDVAAGSVDAARRVSAGREPCDIFASADFEDIELLLEPAGFADYDIQFAKGGMVLAYTTASKNASTIAAATGVFAPPASVPDAGADWFKQLTQPGVAIAGSHPFLDPSGYRADMIFQLTEDHYGVANLYDTRLTHYSISKSTDALGKTYDYQFIYEHSAFAAFNADATKSYRYVRLPDDIGLADPQQNRHYRDATVTIPGLGVGSDDRAVAIPGSRVVWGLTVLKAAPHPAGAIKFLQLLFGPQGIALQTAVGPAPISPPIVSREDFERLPHALRPLVSVSRWHEE
jgi:molybdate/tungstate transport system substrate-binding protein